TFLVLFVDHRTIGRIVAGQNLVRSGSVNVPGQEIPPLVPFQHRLPAVVGKKARYSINRAPHAAAQSVISKTGSVAAARVRQRGELAGRVKHVRLRAISGLIEVAVIAELVSA